MNITTYVPVHDPSIGGVRCGHPTCGSPYWMDCPTHAECEHGHMCDPAHIHLLYPDDDEDEV